MKEEKYSFLGKGTEAFKSNDESETISLALTSAIMAVFGSLLVYFFEGILLFAGFVFLIFSIISAGTAVIALLTPQKKYKEYMDFINQKGNRVRVYEEDFGMLCLIKEGDIK